MQRTVAITGGHGVLGRAVLEAALKAGWQVAVIDHAEGHAAPDGVLEVGGVDLTDPGQAQSAVDAVIARFGRLDALLNIAGGFLWQTTDDAEPAWDRMHALNVTTALNASRAALDTLKAAPEGRIVNVGSAAALMIVLGYPGEISENMSTRWLFWVLAMIPFCYICYELFVGLKDAVDKQPASARGLVSSARYVTIISWLTYPFVYVIPMFGVSGASALVGVQIGYSISDVISKCGVGLMITKIALRKSQGGQGGQGGHEGLMQ